MDNSLLAIVAATVSSLVFIMAILLLLLYQRKPQCCQVPCSCHFFRSPSQNVIRAGCKIVREGASCQEEWNLYTRVHFRNDGLPPPHFSTMGRPTEVQPERCRESQGMQGAEVFCVGLPSSYRPPLWQLARLPSYESVRKKDWQQQTHQLTAQRFGLWACRAATEL